MKLSDLSERLEQAVNEYKDAIAELNQAEKTAETLARAIRDRLDNEREADRQRAAQLEKQCENSPRCELRRIIERLDAADQQAQENSTSSWLRHYRGGGGQEVISKDERDRLERRKRDLERAVVMLPPTAAESELAALSIREYTPTDQEKKEAAQAASSLTEAYQLTRAARDELQAALEAFDEAVKPLRWSLRPDEADRVIERPYQTAQAALDKIGK